MTEIALENAENTHPPVEDTIFVNLVSNEQGSEVLQKITSRIVSEHLVMQKRELRAEIYDQILGTYPALGDASSVDIIAHNADVDGVYDYIKVLKYYADCYHVISNQYGSKAVVFRRIPLDMFSLEVPEDGELHFAVQAQPTAHGSDVTLTGAQQEITDLFATCRGAARDAHREGPALGGESRERHLGSLVRRALRL